MNNATDSASMDMGMTPWLHFGNADYLIFKAWRPSSRGAIVGACMGLFVFSILERCLAAYRRVQEARWKAKGSSSASVSSRSSSTKEEYTEGITDRAIPVHRRFVPPFTPSQDIPRGVVQAIQSTVSYILMLAIMTFNGAYIISIILGLGIGEVLLGRVGRKQKVGA